ncbi:hypothetical protein IFM89_018164 [Coptis chinensis]|uniref:Expansin n=1 Tax=Coptis chinensis TaxID=261450 RepID=A0A835M3T7_9MAGN|nr:hypothetical protein IFM89_018164 [Coptis chinensis]
MAMKIVLALIVMYGLISIVDAFSRYGWTKAHATFYGGGDASGTMDMELNSRLFTRELVGMVVFERKVSRIIIATNFRPPNFAQASNNGGWCNPPLQHFDMAQPAWEKIGIYRGESCIFAQKVGYFHLSYTVSSSLVLSLPCNSQFCAVITGVPCKKHGGVRFTINGRDYFELVLVSNVGGSGSIQSCQSKVQKLDGDNVKELGS